MVSNQKGNVFIGIVATFLIISMVYFLLVPDSKEKEAEKEPLPSPLSESLSESTNIPLPQHPKQPYDGKFSWTNKVDLTENPFGSSDSDLSSQFKFPEKKIQPDINQDLKEPQPAPEKITNIFAETPTGYAFPAKSDYLDGYPYNHDKGSMLVTIDNTVNHSDLLVYLFRISDVTNKEVKKPTFSRAIYVKHGETIVVDDLISGVYSLRWLQLDTGTAYEYQTFDLYKDNKFQYNRFFKFSHSNHGNLKKVPLTAFYPRTAK